jgi:glycosyltransferase involved in cell wall biosynthesis
MPSALPRRVLVIIPAWNEESTVGTTVSEVLAQPERLDVLVVDDGSSDATARAAADAGAEVLRLPFNMGVGGAMRAGFKFAQRNDYDAVIQVDADGQHNANDIKSVISGLENADISIGARFAERGNYKATGPRRWAMVLLALVVSRIAKVRLTDVTSGFRAGNRRAIAQYLDHYPAEYLGDTLDSLVVAVRSGCRVIQVPVEMRPRQGGQPSHNPWKSAVYLLRAVLALVFALTRKRSKINLSQVGA